MATTKFAARRAQLKAKSHLTRHEAAEYAGVSLPTIDRRLRDGLLLTEVIELMPHRVFIERAALDALRRPRRGQAQHSTRKGTPDDRGPDHA